MANTNTNTDINALSTDIYDIYGFFDQIRKDNIDAISDTASMVGIFGYMNEMFSQSLQNTLIAISETSNETIPTKAKFSKNIIAHALNLGINDINAKPATMTVMLYLPITYMENNFTEYNAESGTGKFILDKDIPIFVDNYEFHLDYDVIFTRIKNPDGEYIYTAIYDLFKSGTTEIVKRNPISDINNPYINTVVKYKMNDIEYVAFSANIHQVTNITVEKNILTNDNIQNKTVTFDFEDQLAAFDVDVIENGISTHITPVYKGLLDYTVKDKWCYYEYIDANTIRIIFDRDSYLPGMNSNVRINVKICEGANANFTYNNNFRCSLKSEKYNNYNGMYMLVYPLLNGVSSNGKDKKSISTLKKIIPREASSRGAVINTTDLNNFFNSINDDDTKLYFKKKRDNPFERLYYAYMIMKKDGIIYPTNTLNLDILQEDFNGFSGNNNLSINPGTPFYFYDKGVGSKDYYCSINPPVYSDIDQTKTINNDGKEVRVFKYISPFLITVDDDLISSYLLTIMNDNKTFDFIDINTASNLQFVATNMNWRRNFIYNDSNNKNNYYDNKYVMELSMTQNTNSNYSLIKYKVDNNGKMIFTEKETNEIRVKVFMVLYADDTDKHPYRYIEGELTEYDPTSFIYNFRFTLETDDLMDLTNRINIKGINNAKPEELQKKTMIPNSHGYMNKNTFAKIYILADFGTKVGDIIDGKKVTEETAKVVTYSNDPENNPGNRNELEAVIPCRNDIIDALFNNEIYLDRPDGSRINIINIIKSNKKYINEVNKYNNDYQNTEEAIIRYLRNNKKSDFVINTLLKDDSVIEIIESYSYVDLSRYTLCNILSVHDGIDFYHDYSNIIRSTIAVQQIQETDSNGNLLYKEIRRTDSLGHTYSEMNPIYKTNDNNTFYYRYLIDRIPMIKSDFLVREQDMQDFIFKLEERRKYINVCLDVLEDSFEIDTKFFNTYGPSRMFYYNIPSATSYEVRIGVDRINVYSSTVDEDDKNSIVGVLEFGDKVLIENTNGQWGYIKSPFEGWIKLSNVTRLINYIDNTALNMKFALEAVTSADKYISNNIIRDIKTYMEDINEVNELHIPNIITLITNSYRDQLVYFEFLDVNGYGPACQHLYLNEEIDADVCPEFLNIETNIETEQPEISIAVY